MDNHPDPRPDLHPDQQSTILTTIDASPSAYAAWTEPDEQTLLAMIRQGIGWTEIAQVLGRTTSAVQTRARRIAYAEIFGPPMPFNVRYERDGQPWTDDDLSQLATAVESASSWAEVAERVRRDPAACRRRAEIVALERLREPERARAGPTPA